VEELEEIKGVYYDVCVQSTTMLLTTDNYTQNVHGCTKKSTSPHTSRLVVGWKNLTKHVNQCMWWCF